MTLGSRVNRALVRRVSALWLCGACVLLVVGASSVRAATPHARVAAGGPVCCFRLSIYDDELVHAYYNLNQGNGVTITGGWTFAVDGTAYGLAELESYGGLLSNHGGVATGDIFETNEVIYHSNVTEPFGCTQGFSGYHSLGLGEPFQRADEPYPEYTPPAHGGSGAFDFGLPFDHWGGSECPGEFSTAETQIKKIIGSRCSNLDLLSNPSPFAGAPICGSNLNPSEALRRGEHQVRIKCTENVSGEKEGYTLQAHVAIVIVIVHVARAERKQQEDTLRKFIGKLPPSARNVAERELQELEVKPPRFGSGQLLCGSSS